MALMTEKLNRKVWPTIKWNHHLISFQLLKHNQRPTMLLEVRSVKNSEVCFGEDDIDMIEVIVF